MGTQIPMTTLSSTITTSATSLTTLGSNVAGQTGPALPVNSNPAGNIATAYNGSTAQNAGATPGHASASQGTTGSHTNAVGQPQTTSTSSAQRSQTPVVRKSRKLTHLSHISAATWIGVGLALGALVVAIYYGEPMWRLAKWTAINDFRASCVSDRDLGLQQSAKCKLLLASPAKPPPFAKRALVNAVDVAGPAALRWALCLGLPVVTVVVYAVWFRVYVEDRPRPIGSMARSDIMLIRTNEVLHTERDVPLPGLGENVQEHDTCVMTEINNRFIEESDYVEPPLSTETMRRWMMSNHDKKERDHWARIPNRAPNNWPKSWGQYDTVLDVPKDEVERPQTALPQSPLPMDMGPEKISKAARLQSSDPLDAVVEKRSEITLSAGVDVAGVGAELGRKHSREYSPQPDNSDVGLPPYRENFTSSVKRWMTNLRRRKPLPQAPSGMHQVKTVSKRKREKDIYRLA